MNRPKRLDDDERTFIQEEVISAARALISHELPFLDGIRKLAALRFEASKDHHDPDFMLFTGIESQADHIPNPEVRALCSESWLAECDQDTRELEDLYRHRVSEACARLIERFAGKA